jgi:WD40 repeat protein
MRLWYCVLLIGCCVLPSLGANSACGQPEKLQESEGPRQSPRRTFEGHEYDVRSLEFTPDGKKLASAARDGTIRIWDLNAGVELCRLPRNKDYIAELAFSPDGKILASYGRFYDYKVRLWDIDTGKLLAKFHQDARRVNNDNLGVGLAFSPDAKVLAVASLRDTIVVLRDPGTGKVQGRFEVEGWIDAFAFAPDGKILAISYTRPFDGDKGNGNTVGLWDMSQRKQICVLPKEGRHERMPTCLKFSQDGRRLAELHEGTLRLWDVPSRELLIKFERAGTLEAVAFGPRGEILVAEGDRWPCKTLDIWEVQRATQIARLEVAGDHFMGLSFSPDGSCLATGMDGGRVLIWDLDRRGVDAPSERER